MKFLRLSWIRERAALCVKERRLPYGFYKLKQFLKDVAFRPLVHLARFAFAFCYPLDFLRCYLGYRYRLRRRGGRPQAVEYDLVFVIKKKAPGWILEGICREVGKYFPGRQTLHYADGGFKLPPSKAYFFSHYSFFSKCFRHTPEIWGAKTLVWFPHPKQAGGGETRRLLFALNRATHVVCPCSSNVPLLESRGLKPGKAVCVLGGADPDFFKAHRRNGGAVGFCTAYYPRKSPNLMLEIMRAMPHRKFILVGPASADPANAHRKWDRYPRFKEMLALPNFTYIEGHYRDYPSYYDRMDVLASVSTLEGGPIPLIEALMCNIVPVASRTGFAPDVIRHGENGFIFDVGSPASVVCGLIEKAFELKADVRQSADPELSWEHFSQQIQKLAGFTVPAALEKVLVDGRT